MALISIITVSYNAKESITNTILSVISQDYKQFEYIIIDGGSTDGTLDTIELYLPYFSYFISEPDKGIYDAMNKGVAVAKGEWVIFMNAGDCFVDNEVLSTIFLSNVNKKADIIYGNTIAKYPWGKCLIKGNFFSKHDINLPFCHQSTFVRTSLMRSIPFDLSYRIAADYNFFYTLYKLGKSFKYIDISIALYDAIGFSTNKVLETYMEVCRSNGSNNSWQFKFRLFLFKIRRLAMFVLPKKLVNSYRKHKYRPI